MKRVELAAPTVITVDSADGIALALHDFGGDGRPLLAAHATGFNALTWSPLLAAVDGFHRVALDFRAHGSSPVGDDPDLDWHRFADDVLASLDALEWATSSNTTERPVGIGHSMGGAALLLAEQRRPGTFAGLWVYEPIIFPPEIRGMMASNGNPLAAGALRRRPHFTSRGEATDTYASKPPMNAFDADALAGYVAGGFTDNADGTVSIACRPEHESAIYTTASTCDAFEHLGEVSCPVVVVRGAMQPLGPPAIAEPAANALGNGRLVVHEELSHFGPMEEPEFLGAEIAAFFDSLAD